MKQFLGLLLTFLAISSAQAFWRACHDGMPQATAVSSPQCTATACTFPRGGFLNATIQWTSTAAHATIENFIRFQAAPAVWVTIPITPPLNDACLSMSPGCPTAAGRAETLNLSIPIPATIDPIAATNFEIWLAAITPTPASVVCVQVTANVP